MADDAPVPDDAPVERISDAEARVERVRRTAGFFLAPAIFAALLAAPLGLPAPAHRLAAILAGVVVLWVCESLPLAVTAMLGPILAVLLQVAPVRQVFASFADPVVFVFIGGFMLAEAMFVHRLDRRVAFTALASRFVGSSASRALVVYGAVTTFISAWISNVATTAMMYPIGLAMAAQVVASGGDGAARRALAGGPPLRLGDDAHHLVRRLGRRPGDAGGHTAEPDRHGADRACRRPPHHLRRVGRPRAPGRPDPVRRRGRDVRLDLRPRSGALARRARRRRRRAPQAGPADARASATC